MKIMRKEERKMMKKQSLIDMIDLFGEWNSYISEHPEAAITPLVYTDDDENEVTVIDTDIFWDYLMEHYITFNYNDPQAFYSAKFSVPYNTTSALLNFLREWSNFISIHTEYARLAKMLDRTDYDPLENYDRKEDGGWKDTTDDDAVHKMQYAQVETTTTNDPKIKTKTTGKVYPDDGATAMNDTESITEPVRDNASDVDTVKTTTPLHTDEASVVGDLVVTREFQDYRIHGNVGITTAVQMIEGELKVREKYNIITRCLDAFAKNTLTLRKEVAYYDD